MLFLGVVAQACAVDDEGPSEEADADSNETVATETGDDIEANEVFIGDPGDAPPPCQEECGRCSSAQYCVGQEYENGDVCVATCVPRQAQCGYLRGTCTVGIPQNRVEHGSCGSGVLPASRTSWECTLLTETKRCDVCRTFY